MAQATTFNDRVHLGLAALNDPETPVLRGGVEVVIRAVDELLRVEPQTKTLDSYHREELLLRTGVSAVLRYNGTPDKDPRYALIANIAKVVRAAYPHMMHSSPDSDVDQTATSIQFAVEFAAAIGGSGVTGPSHSRSCDGSSVFSRQFGSRMWSVEFGDDGDIMIAEAGGDEPSISREAENVHDVVASYVKFCETYATASCEAPE